MRYCNNAKTYALTMALLYAADFFLTAWALSSTLPVAEANPLWRWSGLLTILAIAFFYFVSVRFWNVKAIRYGLYIALVIAAGRVVNDVITIIVATHGLQ